MTSGARRSAASLDVRRLRSSFGGVARRSAASLVVRRRRSSFGDFGRRSSFFVRSFSFKVQRYQ
jgi:hypothetical protein